MQLFKTTVQLLGHVIIGATDDQPTGVSPQAEKIGNIRNWPVPKSVKEIRSFLGLAGYYRKFVWCYAAKSAPMTNLTKKETVWLWGPQQQSSFEAIRESLCSAPMLVIADVRGARAGIRPFRVQSDASLFAMGCVLMQDFGAGYQPVAFGSRAFSSAECNYNTTERELRGLVFATCEEFKVYLFGCEYQL